MPITCDAKTERISQKAFGEIAFEVVGKAFAIHDQFGRFFDEEIYQRELASYFDDVRTEAPVIVSHRNFVKRYAVDFLKGTGGLFELKCAVKIHDQHRAQLINYLLMTDLEHGKIINFRPQKVEHEFVNCSRRLSETGQPKIVYPNGRDNVADFVDCLSSLIDDWGVGLELNLYREALAHLLNGQHKTQVFGNKVCLGEHQLAMAAPDLAMVVTGLSNHRDDYRVHLQRFLNRVSVPRIIWANLEVGEVTIEVVCKETGRKM